MKKNDRFDLLEDANNESPGFLLVVWKSISVMAVMLIIMAVACVVSFLVIGFSLNFAFGLESGLCAIGAAAATLILLKVWALLGGAKKLAIVLRNKIGG